MNEEEILESVNEHFEAMKETFEKNKDDTDCIKDNFMDENYIAVYYDNILYMSPSGKYYMPWCTNQTEEDIEEDSFFWEQLESKLSDIGLWYESGEGDALDIFICGHMEGDDL